MDFRSSSDSHFFSIFFIIILMIATSPLMISPIVTLIFYNFLLVLLQNYYYYFTRCKFFIPALADGFSRESKWQQISSGLQDSFQYSSIRPLFSNFSSLFSKPLGTVPRGANYNWCHCLIYIPQFSRFSSKVHEFVSPFAFFEFHSVVHWDGKSTIQQVFFSFLYSFLFFFFFC